LFDMWTEKMPEECVHLKIENNIAFVSLNRADKRNALDMSMFKTIDKISKQLRRNRQIRVVIVQARGEDFCSGLDVKSMMAKKSSMVTLLKKWLPGRANLAQRVSYNWRKIPVPVIMVIQGRCWGGGLQIALGGDFRFATNNASFSIMEGKWGLIPDMGANLALRELVNKDVVLRLAMTAEIISAETALAYGLISDISDDPAKQALKLAEQIAERSPDAVAAVKKLYQVNWLKAEWRMLATETYYQLKVILGKNQARATQRQLNPENKKDYLARKKW